MLIATPTATARNPMPYTLGTAALACGANKSTILRSIKAGKIAATRDEHGAWQIEPAELHRVYPAVATQQAPQPSPPPDATSEVVALLRQQLAEMRESLERERDASDNWRKAFEEERAQRLLAAPSHPTQPPLQQPNEPKDEETSSFGGLRRTWRWLRSTG
jgi:hypothetical protein